MDTSGGEIKGRRWTFAGCEYDELSRVLTVNGKKSSLTGMPLDLLVQFLTHQRVALRKEQLIDAVWQGSSGGNEVSLAQAVSRVRKALQGEKEAFIKTISGLGYLMAVHAEPTFIYADTADTPKISVDDRVPGRNDWRFARLLHGAAADGVWLIRSEMSEQDRVLKMAYQRVRRRTLQREITVARLFKLLSANRTNFVPLLDTNTDTLPLFYEAQCCGQNLQQWAEGEGEVPGYLATADLSVRIGMMIDLAKAVAAAERVGVRHRNIKPSHVLIARRDEGGWHVRLADFGAAAIDDPQRLAAFGLTDPRLFENDDAPGSATMYTAPELLAGKPATIKTEVYALGILLYQMTVGNLQRPISPGWEHEVEEPLLRQDITAAAHTDPEKRLDAEQFIKQLESLAQRRQDRAAGEAVAERNRALTLQLAAETRKLAAARARRPWVLATGAALLAGLVTSVLLYNRAAHQRDIAEAVDRFLSDDLLNRANPYKTGFSNETLVEAVKQASPQIDRRFAAEPLIAANLHHTIAKALDKRMDYADGDKEYLKTAALYRQAQGPLSPDAVIAQMQRSAMHVRKLAAGSLEEGKAIYRSQQQTMDKITHKPKELPIWIDYAQGLIQMYGGDAKAAIATFQDGLDVAHTLPQFNQGVILTMEQLVAVSETRTGRADQAEILIKQMMDTVRRIAYTDKPNLTNLGVNLAQAYMAEQKNKEAIDEVDQVYPTLVGQMGETNPLVMTALGVRAQAENNLGRWDYATRDSLSVNRIIAGKDAYMDAGSLTDAALSQCRGGHFVEGEHSAERAATVGAALAAENKGIDSSIKFALATCLVGLGQYDQAQRLLAKVDAAALAQMYGDADWTVDYALVDAEIKLGLKDVAGASQRLAAAKPKATKPGAAPYRAAWFHHLASSLGGGTPL